MVGNTPIEYLRVLVSACRLVESAFRYLGKTAADIFLVYLFRAVPCNHENGIIRLYQRLIAIAKLCNGTELQRLYRVYAEYLLVAGMLYKHIVAALIGIGSVNIRYIVSALYIFRSGLEVIYKAARLVETHQLSISTSDNALKLRSVKHL